MLMRKKLLTMLLAWMVSTLAGWSQTRQITGVVSDGKSPVIGASVHAKGTNTGTATDVNGRYVLSVPNEATVIIIKALGFKTQEVSIAGLSEIDVKLVQESIDLGEMVVTAFGIERERKTLGYSQQKVGGDEIRKSGEQNVIQGLSGKAAGVYVNGSGGTPGSSSKILLRGNATFTGNNQPLVVVDGVPIDNSTAQSTAGDYPFNQNLSGVNNSNRAVDINPDDIESINILKGPAAAALYGVRAGAGAIIITTKKGKKGTRTFGVDLGSSVEISKVNKLPKLQMKYGQGRGAAGATALTGGGRLVFDTASGTYSSVAAGKSEPGLTPQSWGSETASPTNNAEEFFKTAYSYNNNVAITNNSENSSVRFSLGRLDQNGIVPNTRFERTTARITVDTRVSKKVIIGGTINYINSGGIRSQNGSNLSGVMLALLRAPNSYKLNDPDNGGYKNKDGSQRTYFAPYDNPYWSVHENPFRDNVNRMLGNMNVTIDPFEWISVTYRLGTDMYTDQRKYVFAVGSNQPDNAPGGEINENILRYHEVYSDLLVTFKRDITKDIKGTLLVGNNLNQRFNKDAYSRGRDLGVPGNYNLANAASLYASEYNQTIRTAALFLDLNLAYKNYLFLGLSGRNEWASTFGAAKNNFFYPATNLSFVFSELVSIPKLSFGKIRIAYAYAGINPDPYSTRTYFTRSTYTDGFTGGLSFPYAGINGYGYAATMGNNNLKPERNTGKEIGLDLRFFDGRLGIEYTYFNQTSTDLLVSRPIAPSTGFNASYENLGSMVNKGHELLLSGTPVKMKDFTWDITLNWSRIVNEVLELAPNVKEIDLEAGFSSIGNYAIKGQPYGALYGFKWARTADGKMIIGANGLPTVETTRSKVGNPYPNWFGGIRNTFTYKSVSLTFLFDIRKGGDIWNGTWARLSQLGQTDESADGRDKAYKIDGVVQTGVDPSGNPVYADNTKYISSFNYFRTFKGDAGNYATENAIQDGGWIRLRDLGINYTFSLGPKVTKIVKGLSVGFVARNLWLKTDYKGVDPETSLTGASSNIGGWDYFNNPSTKSYTFSVKASF